MKYARLLPLLLIVCAPVSLSQERDARVEDGVAIRQGRDVKIKGEDLKIAFLSVAEDSRCPDGVKCVWAGNAKVRLSVRNSKDECAEFELNTNLEPAVYDFGKYQISLAHLSPYPSVNGELKPRSYTATVVVTKSK
ncbi:MAG TPA: hypothetical protein VM864_01050 [Pyrinomonadaceae bacterium]|jgi:hypothetical protein|nr:hypothetical protein [Pyrinomonadaceae bacterium]